MNKENPVVCALELGFGTTSVTVGNNNGHPEILTFTSSVSPVSQNQTGLAAGLSTRNTVKVKANQNYYEVGPDALVLSSGKNHRVLNNDYILSDQYLALFLGGIYMCNETTIDLLALGVPVELWGRKDELEKLAVGTHHVQGRNIAIKRVWIIPQPLGGLLAHAQSLGQDEYNKLLSKTILSIDPGYGTVDWLLSSGLKPNENRSGSCDFGMGTVLNSVLKGVSRVFPKATGMSLDHIDGAFWQTPGILRMNGQEYDFPVCNSPIEFDFTPNIEGITTQALTSVRNSAGSGHDIDEILIFGGPHGVYLSAAEKAYPEHSIKVVNNPIQAVCAGLFYGAVQMSKKLCVEVVEK